MSCYGTKTPYVRLILCLVCVFAVAFAYSTESSFAASSIKKAKVTKVNARAVANKTVKVSWKKCSGAEGYTVYYSLKKYGKYKKGPSVAGTKSSVKVGKLKLGKSYYFKVRPFAKKGSGKKYGKYSSRVKCLVKPSAPKKVRALTVSPTIRKLTYSKVAGVSGYEIWRSTNKTGKYKKIEALSGTAFNNTKLDTKTNYYYKVRSYVKVGKKMIYSGYSAVSTIETGGNASKYNINNIPTNYGALKDRKILFLGSSITLGEKSEKVSFVDYLKKKDGVDVVAKEAISGTTLSFAEDDSYCERLMKYNGDSTPGLELLVCQLSSNDARSAVIFNESKKLSVEEGESVSDATGVETEQASYTDEQVIDELYEAASSEPHTVEAAIKYIIAYSNLELGVPVMFYVIPPFKTTGTFDAEFYKEMRQCLIKLTDPQSGWVNENENSYGIGFDVELLDMWTHSSFSNFTTYNQTRGFYMWDSVHPTKAGYFEKYLPIFEKKLNSINWE